MDGRCAICKVVVFLMVLQAGCYNGCYSGYLLRHCKVVTVDFCVVAKGIDMRFLKGR